MKKIYLIRHCETTGDIEDRFGGDYDDHLTEAGEQQAHDLGKVLKDNGIDVIVHSPRIRARKTAEIVSEHVDASLEEVVDLRERNNYGVLTGLTKQEGKDQHPEEVEKIQKDKTYHDVKDSEDYESFKQRMLPTFEAISKRSETTIAIITHGGVIGCIMREIFGHENFKIGDCGVIEIDYDGDSYSVASLTNARAI